MANKIYYVEENEFEFGDAALGLGVYRIDITSLGAGTGKISSAVDLGTTRRSGSYMWRGTVKINSPVVGEIIQLFVVTSNGTIADGNMAATFGSIASNDRRNLQLIGCLEVTSASGPLVLAGSGRFDMYGRYVQFALWNATTSTFTATPSDHQFYITSIPDEIQ